MFTPTGGPLVYARTPRTRAINGTRLWERIPISRTRSLKGARRSSSLRPRATAGPAEDTTATFAHAVLAACLEVGARRTSRPHRQRAWDEFREATATATSPARHIWRTGVTIGWPAVGLARAPEWSGLVPGRLGPRWTEAPPDVDNRRRNRRVYVATRTTTCCRRTIRPHRRGGLGPPVPLPAHRRVARHDVRAARRRDCAAADLLRVAPRATRAAARDGARLRWAAERALATLLAWDRTSRRSPSAQDLRCLERPPRGRGGRDMSTPPARTSRLRGLSSSGARSARRSARPAASATLSSAAGRPRRPSFAPLRPDTSAWRYCQPGYSTLTAPRAEALRARLAAARVPTSAAAARRDARTVGAREAAIGRLRAPASARRRRRRLYSALGTNAPLHSGYPRSPPTHLFAVGRRSFSRWRTRAALDRLSRGRTVLLP